jgi:hypothetical protein
VNIKDHRPDGDVQHPVNARKVRRLRAAARDRRFRKGNRKFYANQMRDARARETVAAQLRVLELGPDAPGNADRYRNVSNARRAAAA